MEIVHYNNNNAYTYIFCSKIIKTFKFFPCTEDCMTNATKREKMLRPNGKRTLHIEKKIP